MSTLFSCRKVSKVQIVFEKMREGSFVAVLLVILYQLAGVLAEKEISCARCTADMITNKQTCEASSNMCQGTPSKVTQINSFFLTNIQKPFCVNIANKKEEPLYVCRECEYNCDCPLGYYCVKAQVSFDSVYCYELKEGF
jgi:hypothetical protein